MSAEALSQPSLPTDVLDAYCGDRPVNVSHIGNGEINVTYLLTEPATEADQPDRKIILQRVNTDVFDPRITEDFVVVTNHLAQEGWEVPQAVPTEDGTVHHVDTEGGVWRAMTFLESDGKPQNSESPALYTKYGELLANMHGSLARLDYEPHSIPHFHDTPYYAGRMREVLDQLPDAETRATAEALLAAYDTLNIPEDATRQLIHADPKTDNMLFRNGEPFTYIDWDTLMDGTIWVDIGDMLRSVVEDAVHQGAELPVDKIRCFSEGYRQVAAPEVEPAQFEQWVVASTQQIAIELGMRYLTDVADNSYWSWNLAEYPTRYDYCTARTATQLKIYHNLSQLQPTGDQHV